jgi:hypothetical protein
MGRALDKKKNGSTGQPLGQMAKKYILPRG